MLSHRSGIRTATRGLVMYVSFVSRGDQNLGRSNSIAAWGDSRRRVTNIGVSLFQSVVAIPGKVLLEEQEDRDGPHDRHGCAAGFPATPVGSPVSPGQPAVSACTPCVRSGDTGKFQ